MPPTPPTSTATDPSARRRSSVLTVLVLVLAALALTIGPSPAPAHAGARSASVQVLQRIDELRTQAGCAPLKRVAAIDRAATRHARLMMRRGQLSHQLSGEATLRKRLAASGYRGSKVVGEVLGFGMPTAGAAVAAWLNSPPHRAILLDCRLRTTGVGIASDAAGRRWWAIDFARR